MQMGVFKLGTVSFDGTKINANAPRTTSVSGPREDSLRKNNLKESLKPVKDPNRLI